MKLKNGASNQIIEATIHLVAQNGLENLSTRKVAAECGVSDGYLFNYFENKNDLLVKCLYYIDNEIDAELKKANINILYIKKSVRELWFAYFGFLISHGDYAKYYRQFRHSSYYNDEVIKGQDKSFAFFVKLISMFSSRFRVDQDIFWVYLIETTLNFAIRVVDGQLPGKAEDTEKYFSLLVNGISGIIKDTNDWNKDDNLQ